MCEFIDHFTRKNKTTTRKPFLNDAHKKLKHLLSFSLTYDWFKLQEKLRKNKANLTFLQHKRTMLKAS